MSLLRSTSFLFLLPFPGVSSTQKTIYYPRMIYRYVSTSSGKTHYQVLGVKHTATPEEIKQAFARLVKELHPDTNPSLTSAESSSLGRGGTFLYRNSTAAASTQKIMELKEAFDILRDQTKRTTYDQQLSFHRSLGYDPETLHRRAERFRKQYQQQTNYQSQNDWYEYTNGTTSSSSRFSAQHHLIRIIEILIRPRMILIPPFVALLSWYLMSITHENDYYSTEGGPYEKIKAWFNPTTQRWETPAPWDPIYQQYQKNTKYVNRREVYVSVPPVTTKSIKEGQNSV